MVTSNYNQYSNARPLLGTLPAHLTGEDAERVAAFQLYEEIYWNVPDTFTLTQRGTEDNPIYIPSARMVVEAMNRFYGVGLDYRVSGGSDADREAVGSALRTLFRREKFFSKYNSLKRFALVRGDAFWHIIADDTKPEGRRISIHELQPERYFPIYEPDDIDRITGCHLIQMVTEGDETAVQRQTYRKNPDNPQQILSSLAVYKSDAWDDRNLAQESDFTPPTPVRIIKPEFALPDAIKSIPVYHIKNQWQSGHLFGNSDIRSFERIISAVNQGITDEELALALDGLGVYWTTADRPAGGWTLGPGSVIEGEENEDFRRVSGVGTVEPSQSHLNWLLSVMKESGGTPDIAVGRVDVSVAESGISLALQMGPLLAKAAEKEAEMLAVHDNMFFDLTTMWFPAYEGIAAGPNVTVEPFFADPMPTDRAAVIAEILALYTAQPPLISAEYARYLLSERLGFEFPDTMGADIISSIRAVSEATTLDPFEERVRKELAADLGAGANGTGATA
jgi:hypothetical protein